MIAAAFASVALAVASPGGGAHQAIAQLTSISEGSCRRISQIAADAKTIDDIRVRPSTTEPVDIFNAQSMNFTDAKFQYIFQAKDVVVRGDISHVRGTFRVEQVPALKGSPNGTIGWLFTRTAP